MNYSLEMFRDSDTGCVIKNSILFVKAKKSANLNKKLDAWQFNYDLLKQSILDDVKTIILIDRDENKYYYISTRKFCKTRNNNVEFNGIAEIKEIDKDKVILIKRKEWINF